VVRASRPPGWEALGGAVGPLALVGSGSGFGVGMNSSKSYVAPCRDPRSPLTGGILAYICTPTSVLSTPSQLQTLSISRTSYCAKPMVEMGSMLDLSCRVPLSLYHVLLDDCREKARWDVNVLP